MITISDALTPEHVKINLTAGSFEDALTTLVASLKNDERVDDWATLVAGLRANPPCKVSEVAEFGICIPHARTNAVTSMVMSAGRCDAPLFLPDCDRPIRYFFCIGVPQTMAADYLRSVGSLMRLMTDPETENSVRDAKSPAEFVSALSGLERKLR
jgi:mannitol/fructose-specific phosphotransferase system IIA component (Ntr-type)